jgi:hypothetical protein
MGVTVEQGKNGVWVMRVNGAMRKEELDAAQAALLTSLAPLESIKVLAIVGDDFAGWVGGEVWNDMGFFYEHGDRIEKIAIIGDAKWETEMMMFTCAGLRRAPVKYFAPGQLSEAYNWLG